MDFATWTFFCTVVTLSTKKEKKKTYIERELMKRIIIIKFKFNK